MHPLHGLNQRPPASRPQPQSLRFQGYRLTPSGDKAQLVLPGFWNPHNAFHFKIRAKALEGDTVSDITFQREGHYWVSDKQLPLGTPYRFRVEEQYHGTRDVFDNLHVKDIQGELYNVISPYRNEVPKKSVVMADVFLDSLLSRDKLETLLRQLGKGDLLKGMRNHFNKFGGDELGLKEILPILRQAGFTGVLLKPFIGGDNLSSHRYWTVDPYVLNDSFSSKEAFDGFLIDALKQGFKVFSDGAFVNLGLNSPQFLSNNYDGFRSPYWDWFIYDQENDPTKKPAYPREAFEKHKWPILPSKLNPRNGLSMVDYDSTDFRILNDPDQPGFDPKRPTFVEFFNPNLDALAHEERVGAKKVLTNEDSIQTYQIRVSPQEVRQKREQERKIADPQARKKLFLEWRYAVPVAASKGGMPVKWYGQNDVIKLNMKNPDVQAYIRGAMEYWTRYSNRVYVDVVGRALAQARANDPDGNAQSWIKAITEPADAETTGQPEASNYVLPKPIFEQWDRVSDGVCDAAMKAGQEKITTLPAEKLVEALGQEYPIGALPLPTYFKSVLSHPTLAQELKTERIPLVLRLIGMLLQPIVKPLSLIPAVKSFFDQVVELCRPVSFMQQLENKLSAVVKDLPPETRLMLNHQSVYPLLGEPVAQALYLQLLTGQTATDPEAIENGFYETLNEGILSADPETAKNLLIRFMKKRLKQTDLGFLKEPIKKALEGHDPAMLSLARAVLNSRELGGLNWRGDAAKDVGDFDRVEEAEDPKVRARLFLEEIKVVQSFWANVTESIRNIFPKATVIAELTDFEKLSNPKVARQAYQTLFETNVFTSAPNMTYMYNTPMRLVHYAPRPDEFGDTQMKPSEFLKALKQMSQAVPLPSLFQYQNMTASHDYPTTAHALLINPAIATQDLLKWWGVKDDFREAVAELLTKTEFEPQRQYLKNLGVRDFDTLRNKLIARAEDSKLLDVLSPEVREYYSEHQKKVTGSQGEMLGWIGPNPVEIKRKFVNELFEASDAEQLGLDENTYQDVVSALAQQIVDRVSEPSEVRAMRAVVSNTLQGLAWDKVAAKLEIPEHQASLIANRLQELLPDAYTQIIAEFGRHWGYQPLEIALENLFKAFPPGWSKDLPGESGEQIKRVLSDQIYEQAMTPVLDKLRRIIALQVAAPGNPSVYLPDLFAQTGSELIKNMFVQNRNAVRYDWLEEKPYLKQFYDDVSAILKLRHRYPVLNDGVVLDIETNDDEPVVPVVRDNGVDQAIILVNTGKPVDIGWDKVGFESHYKRIDLIHPDSYRYRLDLSGLKDCNPATRYYDPETLEEFRVNEQGVLVKIGDKESTIEVPPTCRVLLRKTFAMPDPIDPKNPE